MFLFRCNWFDTTSHAGIWKNTRYGIVEVYPPRPYPSYDPFVLAAMASQVYYAPSPGNQRRAVRGRRGWISVFTTRARSVIDGFTDHQQDVGQQSEDTNDPGDQEYQDNDVPGLRLHVVSEADNDPINLATGQTERINEPVNFIPTGPMEDDIYMEDDGIEYHSGDEYEDTEGNYVE